MTTDAIRDSVFPSDLQAVLGRDELLRLTYEAVGRVDWPRRSRGDLEQAPDLVLCTLLVVALASGRYSTQQIESEIAHEPALRYAASGFRPPWEAIRSCRRIYGRVIPPRARGFRSPAPRHTG